MPTARWLGIVTEGDFLRRAETATERRRPRWLEFLMGPGRLADEYVHTHTRKVADVMTPDPYTVTEGTPLEDVVQIDGEAPDQAPARGAWKAGCRHRQPRQPAARAGELGAFCAGIGATDEIIRERLMTELERQKWAPLGWLNVVVQNGVVELWGTITDERERQALIVAAQNIPGVKDVHDHVVWIEPMSGVVIGAEGEVVAA